MFGISYWIIPIFSGCVWLGGLLAMLCTWIVKGSPKYSWMDTDQHIAYISSIGATEWGQPIFIATSATMVVTFDLVFISERWLRHKRRLAPNYSKWDKLFSIGSIVFAILGAAGLILLTIFNTRDFSHVHEAMLGVFIGGYIISAIFVCAEYQRLGYHYREHEYRILRASFWMKLAFIVVEIGLAISFGVTEYVGRLNTSGILEWIVSLVYIFYVWSFVIDFLPATKTKAPHSRFPPMKRADDEMAMETEARGNNMGGPVYTNGGYGGANDFPSYRGQTITHEANRNYEMGPMTPGRNV